MPHRMQPEVERRTKKSKKDKWKRSVVVLNIILFLIFPPLWLFLLFQWFTSSTGLPFPEDIPSFQYSFSFLATRATRWKAKEKFLLQKPFFFSRYDCATKEKMGLAVECKENDTKIQDICSRGADSSLFCSFICSTGERDLCDNFLASLSNSSFTGSGAMEACVLGKTSLMPGFVISTGLPVFNRGSIIRQKTCKALCPPEC